jgi:hypothetical protein
MDGSYMALKFQPIYVKNLYGIGFIYVDGSYVALKLETKYLQNLYEIGQIAIINVDESFMALKF